MPPTFICKYIIANQSAKIKSIVVIIYKISCHKHNEVLIITFNKNDNKYNILINCFELQLESFVITHKEKV